MALYRSPAVSTVPYVDSPGSEYPAGAAPDDQQAFYEDMERREILERKLSKRKSNSGGSIWSRKSLKRWTITPPPVPPGSSDLPRAASSSNLQIRNDNDEAMIGGQQKERPRLNSSSSVIADSREIPPLVDTSAWAAVPLPAFKVHYPLHNPFGPRRYRNHHLIPPSQKRPSMRPPTFFSPSFPPMHTNSAPENLDDDRPESSNTNANSPLPTPTSSQTRVAEGTKPRSRKTSQTAPDNVDLLDVTDPWGTNWHHQSPYDIGQTTAAVSDSYDIPNRTRRASMTAMHTRNKSVAPSPLSQSTSAVHLQPSQPEIQIPRKLSKRRTPTVDNVFHPQPPEIDRKTTSAPVTPIERRYVAPSQSDNPAESLPKRMSVVPAPVYSTLHQTPKKEKRGSVLNRLAKKFSLLRKPSEDNSPSTDWWHHIDNHEIKGYTNAFDAPGDQGRKSPQKSARESVKRVPPPSVDNLVDPPAAPAESVQNIDRLSVGSIEAPYSMGRLTITNPDLMPDNEKRSSLANEPPPPPPEKPKDNVQLSHPASDSMISQGQTANTATMHDVPLRFDKPLPPPQLATPEMSQLRLSDVRTAQALEQLLPSLSRTNSPVSRPAELVSQPNESSAIVENNHPSTGDKPAVLTVDQSQIASPAPIADKELQETPKKLASQPTDKDKPTLIRESSVITETTPDRNKTRSPSVTPQSKKETPKKTSSQSQPARNAEGKTSRNLATEGSWQDPSAEASTSTQRPKLSQAEPRVESGPVAAVPFPTTQRQTVKSLVREYEGSPLSTSSMLANPPTPYDHRASIALSDSAPPTLPPKSIYEGKTQHNRSPTNASPSRQTETFKLVRSSSGNVYASNQTITAAGQQWEVVESVEVKAKKEKSSTKPKEQERKSKDHESRGKERDHRPREHERHSKDYEYRARDKRRSREYDRWSRDHDRARDDYKYRDDYRSREDQRTREEHLVREERRLREERAREREERRIREIREEYRLREEQKMRDERRAKEEQRIREERRAREKEEQRVREWEEQKAREREEQKAREREREEQRAREREERKAREREERKIREWEEQRAREREEKRLRDWEEQRAREERKAREREEQKAREREEQKAREREEQKAREREEQKAREREEQKAREREEQKAREREEQKAREREEQKAREREEQKAREQAEQEAREREAHRLRELEEQKARKLEEMRIKDEERIRDERRRKDYERRSRDEQRLDDHNRTAKEYKPQSKDHDLVSRREPVKEASHYQSSYQWPSQQPPSYPAESSNKRSNGMVASHHHGERSRHDDFSHRPNDHHGRNVDKRPVSDTSSSSDYYGTVLVKSDPVDIPSQFSNPPQLRLERNPSLTARPTSQLPSAAEMNAVRAKESWEMERLWKARSMYGFEPNAQITDFIPGSSSSSSSRSDDIHTQSAVYGSSHTAYVVQTPFQGNLGTQIYHSMPTGPPPVIYSSPSSIPSIPDNLSSYEPYDHVYRSFTAAATPSDYRSPPTLPRPTSDYRHSTTVSRPPLNNPLPEPPRESQIELSGLKNAKDNDKHSSDYWTKYNGITTTH
ncbi:hypothetical protein JR316_0000625 [Psilocybe cubensis]|uniref:Uncharacterized protein n=2 Tax=Psilocybe cubensis TaxID=181762 RepID=A0ACB8HHG5_PSICU|nr:hypothetical protein JR316_0000625 [Psilocybe cubensis]KAH9486560.1 hypothetical protein JR316_0000625 [Psilocybe cubensis]